MTESCANCRFVAKEYQDHYGYEYPVCRRFPPVDRIRREEWDEGHFTRTKNDWWCGEWEATRETPSGDPKNDDGQTGDGAISYADILVCASVRGNCGTVHSSIEEWKNCRACNLPPLPWSIRAQIFKDEEPPK